MKRKISHFPKLLLLMSSLVAFDVAYADSSYKYNAPYAGLGIADAKASEFCDITAASLFYCENKSLAGKAFAGYRFNKNIALETSYVNYGEVSAHYANSGFGEYKDKLSAHSLAIAAKGILPLSKNTELFGKIGMHHWELDASSTETTSGVVTSVTSVEAKGFDPAYGIGISFAMGKNAELIAELERYTGFDGGSASNISDMDIFSLQAAMYF